LVSGYVLKRVEGGEPAVMTLTLKDEVCIWLSRYKPLSLPVFLELLPGYTSLEIVSPAFEDQLNAVREVGKYPLGFTDLITLSVMRKLGLKEIYSSDTGFDSVPNVKRIFRELEREEGYLEFKAFLEKQVA
jgi:predicted nucleic acid-binding protein